MPEHLSGPAVGAFLANFSPDAQALARAARDVLDGTGKAHRHIEITQPASLETRG
jgi:hypothetical protein